MPRRAGGRRRLSLFLVVMAAGCTPARLPADGNLQITFDITGRVQRSGVVLSHAADSRHGCEAPRRVRLATAAGPAPTADQPPNTVFGYTVAFGPHVPTEAGVTPEWRGFGAQTGFTLEVFPQPGAVEAAGPVALGRAFRITIGTAEGLWQRSVAEDDPPSAGIVVIDPDGMGGQFRARGLVRQIPHNRLPDSEAISVVGTWRCPAR
jgi:hypothetical protein